MVDAARTRRFLRDPFVQIPLVFLNAKAALRQTGLLRTVLSAVRRSIESGYIVRERLGVQHGPVAQSVRAGDLIAANLNEAWLRTVCCKWVALTSSNEGRGRIRQIRGKLSLFRYANPEPSLRRRKV